MFPRRGRNLLRQRDRLRSNAIFAFFVAAYVILFGAFRNILAGLNPADPIGATADRFWIYTILVTIYLVVLCLAALAAPLLARTLKQNLPLLALPLLAFASILWSVDPVLTLQSSLTYGMLFMTGLVVCSVLGRDRAIRIALFAGAAIIAASIAICFLWPEFGIHQSWEASSRSHAGSWRGVFNHRTKLGQFSAFMLLLTVCLRQEVYSRPTAAIVCALALVCIAKANSAGALVTLVLGGATMLALSLVLRIERKERPLMLLIISVVVVLIVIIYNPLIAWSLEALGKEAHLSGRSFFWEAIFYRVGYYQGLGFGYVAGFREIATPVLISWGYENVPNAQNGYVDIYLAFGITGLLIFAGVAAAYVWRGMRLILVGAELPKSTFQIVRRRAIAGVVLVVAAAQISPIESFIVEDNSFLVPLIALLLPAVLPANPGRPLIGFIKTVSGGGGRAGPDKRNSVGFKS